MVLGMQIAPPTLTTQEAGEILGLTSQGVRGWINKGLLVPSGRTGRAAAITFHDLALAIDRLEAKKTDEIRQLRNALALAQETAA